MVFSKNNMSFIILLLSGSPAQGARVAIHEASVDKTNWGRSCSSLETRFQNQQSRLAESEGNTALVRSVSLMRTLRRANARECSWIQDEDLDVSAISELAGSYLQQSPCYEQSQSALRASQLLPEDERENAVMDGLAILLSNHENCSPDGEVSEPELGDTSDETLEEEMDDTTDNIMEVMVSHPESSLIQQEKFNPLMALAVAPQVALSSWTMAFGFGPIVFIGIILFTIVLAMFCGRVMHALVRMFRWMRCKLSGNSCEEYAPATWLQNFVRGGCAIASLTYGPATGILLGVGFAMR